MGTSAERAAVVDRSAASLRDVGYVVIGEALAVREVEELRAAFGPATPGSTSHVVVDERTPARDRWLSLAEHPAVAGLLAALLGTYDVDVHGRDPGERAGAQGLHADRPAGRAHDVDGITVLWMLDDFTESTGLSLPEGPYETVAGYVLAELGRLPLVGDVVTVERRQLTVTELDGRRIARISVSSAPGPEGEDDDEAAAARPPSEPAAVSPQSEPAAARPPSGPAAPPARTGSTAV